MAVHVLGMERGGDGAVELARPLRQKVTQRRVFRQKLGRVRLRNAGEQQHALHGPQGRSAFLTHIRARHVLVYSDRLSFYISEQIPELEIRTLRGSPGFSRAALGSG